MMAALRDFVSSGFPDVALLFPLEAFCQSLPSPRAKCQRVIDTPLPNHQPRSGYSQGHCEGDMGDPLDAIRLKSFS